MSKPTNLPFLKLFLLLCIFFSISPHLSHASPSALEFKIGAIIPLSGSNARHGEFVRQGIEMALQEVGKDHGLSVIYEDNQSLANKTVSAYRKLVDIDKVNALLTIGSPMAMVLSSLANKDKVLLFSIASTPRYSSPHDYTFRVSGSATQEAKFIFKEVVKKLKKKRIAILYAEDDYGQGTAEEFKNAIADNSLLVYEQSFLPHGTDYRTQLLKARAKNPDLLFIVAWGADCGLILKQAKQLGLDTTFLCPQASLNPDLLKIAKDKAEGLLVAAPSAKSSPSFAKRYKKKHGQDPTFVTLRMYDSTRILSHLAEECRSDRFLASCLKDSMERLEDFPGSSYQINFDGNGDINESFELNEVKDGSFRQVVD